MIYSQAALYLPQRVLLETSYFYEEYIAPAAVIPFPLRTTPAVLASVENLSSAA